MKWIALRVIVGCVVGFFASSSRVFAVPQESFSYQAGVHLSREHRLKDKQIKVLIDGLTCWTGLREINIDASGRLGLGDRTSINGGSRSARELIIAAVDSQDSFELQRRDNSSMIAFAQIESRQTYIDEQDRKHTLWELKIDFADFTQLAGDKEVRAAFDPAINVVHELAHAIRGYFDPLDTGDELGECERYVNKMRFDLGLPQRRHYYPQYRLATNPDGSSFTQGEFTFYGTKVNKGEEEFQIRFNLDRVFDLSQAKSKAAAHAKLLAYKRNQLK